MDKRIWANGHGLAHLAALVLSDNNNNNNSSRSVDSLFTNIIDIFLLNYCQNMFTTEYILDARIDGCEVYYIRRQVHGVLTLGGWVKRTMDWWVTWFPSCFPERHILR